MKKTKKILAVVSSMAVLATSATVLSTSSVMSASAASSTAFPGSTLEYTAFTREISSNIVELVVKVTNNPGIECFEFAVIADDGCSYIKSTKEYSYTTGYNVGETNEENHRTYCVYTDPFHVNETDSKEFCLRYKITGNAAQHDFKIGITMMSTTEGDYESSFNKKGDNSLFPTDAVVEVTPSVKVRLGDLDNSGSVTSSDWSLLQSLISYAPNKQMSTVYLDQQLQNRSSTLSKRFPNLKCAAVADIDHDAVIQKADSDAMGQYLAEYGAGMQLTNKEINTLFPVTVVYDK